MLCIDYIWVFMVTMLSMMLDSRFMTSCRFFKVPIKKSSLDLIAVTKPLSTAYGLKNSDCPHIMDTKLWKIDSHRPKARLVLQGPLAFIGRRSPLLFICSWTLILAEKGLLKNYAIFFMAQSQDASTKIVKLSWQEGWVLHSFCMVPPSGSVCWMHNELGPC